MSARPFDVATFARTLVESDLSALDQIVEFTIEEEAVLREGVHTLPSTLAQVGAAILDAWEHLTTAERVAALLVLANALAAERD